jgi:hypothetical protein
MRSKGEKGLFGCRWGSRIRRLGGKGREPMCLAFLWRKGNFIFYSGEWWKCSTLIAWCSRNQFHWIAALPSGSACFITNAEIRFGSSN